MEEEMSSQDLPTPFPHHWETNEGCSKQQSFHHQLEHSDHNWEREDKVPGQNLPLLFLFHKPMRILPGALSCWESPIGCYRSHSSPQNFVRYGLILAEPNAAGTNTPTVSDTSCCHKMWSAAVSSCLHRSEDNGQLPASVNLCREGSGVWVEQGGQRGPGSFIGCPSHIRVQRI